ncbi:MAG: hypothetical protein ABIY55_22300 [Kofleriaceae bacterium]
MSGLTRDKNDDEGEADYDVRSIVPLVVFLAPEIDVIVRKEFVDIDIDKLLTQSSSMGSTALQVAGDKRQRLLAFEIRIASAAIDRTLPMCVQMRQSIAERLWGAERATLAVGALGVLGGMGASTGAIFDKQALAVATGLLAGIAAAVSLVSEYKRHALRANVNLVSLLGVLAKASSELTQLKDLFDNWSKEPLVAGAHKKRVMNSAKRALELVTEIDGAIAEVPPPIRTHAELKLLKAD